MANTTLFPSSRGRLLTPTDATNSEGAPAYAYPARRQLAQYAVTGCLNRTFYASAEAQLETVLALCQEVDPLFIAKTAVYCRQKGYMKDMPALFTAILSNRRVSGYVWDQPITIDYFPTVFARVIDSGKMLRTFVQIMRSGVTGRKSLGTRPKLLIQQWLNTASERQLIEASVGTSPSLADVVKMVHPHPADPMRNAFFAWLLGKDPYIFEDLPEAISAFELYKLGKSDWVPPVPFQMLTALRLDAKAWTKIALQSGWHMVRMNLNTFARHKVFDLPGMADKIAAKLRDPEAIRNARVFPYQLLVAYLNTGPEVPRMVKDALQDALEVALENVPTLPGNVVVCPDVSGSMSSPVTGHRKGSTTAVRCVDVAALIAAALLRKNPRTVILPFESRVVDLALNSRDTVLTNANKLAAVGGGGTNCSAPLTVMNRLDTKADLVIYVSDNESWMDARPLGLAIFPRSTRMMEQWEAHKQRNPKAKLVCVDLTPNTTTQVYERADILNIGGFSDEVFNLIDSFARGELTAEHWIDVIEAVEL